MKETANCQAVPCLIHSSICTCVSCCTAWPCANLYSSRHWSASLSNRKPVSNKPVLKECQPTGCAARPTPISKLPANVLPSSHQAASEAITQPFIRLPAKAINWPVSVLLHRPAPYQSLTNLTVIRPASKQPMQPLVFSQYGRLNVHIHGQVRSKQAQSR